ncbi:hypothetical protein DM02DRAFT_546699, partial [Periconia macrospinosa]
LPPMSDETERLFSSAKLLIVDRRSVLKMDIIEANECLRAWYGKPRKGTFDEKDVGVEGEQWDNSGDKVNGDDLPISDVEDGGDGDVYVE